MKTLSIIGCGKVGTAIGHLYSEQSVFSINDILNRSLSSGRLAAERIGSGRAVAAMRDLQAADIFMIAAPDDQISQLCQALCAASVLRKGDVVFHCSGALSSKELNCAKKGGAWVASVHPLKTFARGKKRAVSFAGTHCAIEGNGPAVAILKPAFEAIGGHIFKIEAESKLIYHAASVFACNYLTALIEVGAQAYEAAGLARETAMQLIQPLVRETIANIFAGGTSQALTGPIARGDIDLVTKQLEVVALWNLQHGDLYKSLGSVALSLAQQQNQGATENWQELANLLDNQQD